MAEKSMSQIRAELESEYRRTGRIGGRKPKGNVRQAIKAEADRRWDEQRQEGGLLARMRGEVPGTVAHRIASGGAGELREQVAEDAGRFFGGAGRLLRESGRAVMNAAERTTSPKRSLGFDLGSGDGSGAPGSTARASVRSAPTGSHTGALTPDQAERIVNSRGGSGETAATDDEFGDLLAALRGPGQNDAPGFFGGGDQGKLVPNRNRPSRRVGSPDRIMDAGHSDLGSTNEGVRVPQGLWDNASAQERKFLPLIVEMADRHGVKPALLYGLIKSESNFNPDAVNRANKNGTVDYGIAQINSKTLKGLGKEAAWARNPRNAIDYAARRLAGSMDKYGSETAALIEYNGGSGRADEYMATGKWPYATAEEYVGRVLGLAQAFDPNDLFDVDGPEPVDPLESKPIQLANPEDVQELAKQLGREVIGRFPNEDQLGGIVDMIHNLQRSEQERDYGSELAAQQTADLGVQHGEQVTPQDVWNEQQVGSVANQIAEHFGLSVTSHKRSEEHNREVGGAKESDHLWGGAIDLGGSREARAAAEAWAKTQTGPDAPFRIVLGEGDSGHDDHVHISWNKNSSAPISLPGGATVAPAGGGGGNVQPGAGGGDPYVSFDVYDPANLQNAVARHLEDLFPEEAGAKKIMDQGEQFLSIIGAR